MARKREYLVEAPQKSLELKKHVAVIHSNNKLTLLQRKIANALLFNAYHELLLKDEHEIHIASLCRLIGYDSNDHKTIKKALVNLLSTVLEWNLVDGEKLNESGIWNASSIIADASIEGSRCTYSYSNKMRQLLHRPNIYGRLDMSVQARFQSTYGLALYENCNRFQDIGKSPWFELAKFRKLMGVEDNKYSVFRDFKTRVLDKAVQEVNKYSSIRVEPQLRRLNRKVVAIQFLIRKVSGEQVVAVNTGTPQLVAALKEEYRLTKKQINEVLAAYETDYILEKIRLIEESVSFKEGKIVNLTKYLLSALKENYQAAPSSKKKLTAKASNKAAAPRRLMDFDKEKRSEQEQLLKYRYYQDNCLLDMFNTLAESDQDKILKEFEKYMHTTARGVYVDIFLRDGLANPLVQDQLCLFLRQHRQHMLNEIASYAKWSEVG